jgi:hypothetical protein
MKENKKSCSLESCEKLLFGLGMVEKESERVAPGVIINLKP